MGDDGRNLGLLLKSLAVKTRPADRDETSSSPYKGLPAHQFWRRSISTVEPHRIDPVTQTRFKIGRNAQVGTAGSCFAQHISRRIMASGFNYLVTETGEGFDEQARVANNYGVFSARYGNIYTTVQLLQLFEEAFGERVPLDRAWIRPDGRFIDPYRQQVEPPGFADEDAVLADRSRHLAAVRRLFEDTDIFVFTLGLTEAWRSRRDGSVFSAAPGVVGGAFDDTEHEFVNFDVAQTYDALSRFLEKLHVINPGVKVLLTVSPIPLIATYEPRSVLVSTTYSKSVLRVAAEMAIREFDWVDYFPSYEIITGSFSGGLYYQPDWREVNALGVSHAMRCFMNNYIEGRGSTATDIAPEAVRSASASDIVCDEEIMDSVRI
ncbi:GSCFA domain-containing protein [Sphingomonas colocasiae]|uniref:GSCFA domain-containing protein n=2 Tax=Sphingomonas colocasiae TaxID=1848973 RepID=A0ABS7PNZ7_9SPHN|nr:GSCFA domain-containing protein [Sphingomonas colocasiae]